MDPTDSWGRLVMGMHFAPAGPRFIMDSPELGFTVRRCALLTVAAIDTP
jgi:hypothetical protein